MSRHRNNAGVSVLFSQQCHKPMPEVLAGREVRKRYRLTRQMERRGRERDRHEKEMFEQTNGETP